MEIEKIVPKDGPTIDEFKKYIDKYKDQLIVIKYGGNVFIDRNIFNNFISDISILNRLGLSIIIVHGGGPRIKRELDKSNIQSKFIRGLRVTDEKIINIVENVLIDFNEDIVNSLVEKGANAVSLNTKKNNAIEVIPEREELGFVGIPNKINVDIIKDIIKIKKILDLQENQFYSLKAIKNNPQLLTTNSSNSKIVIREYSKRDALKKAGLKEDDFYELIDYKYEQNKDIYTQQDVNRFSSLAYLFSLGLGVKNLSVIKSMSDRGVGFFETYFKNSDNDPEEIKIAIDKFSEIVGSYILEDL